jgi:serine/threonine protein kinase
MSDTIVLPQSPVAGPRPGDVIAGKYRLERELGRGAMGTVWSAVHTTLAQRVAIKLIAGEQSRSVDARQRFGVEAKAAARLRSRHVVQVYDDGETPEGAPYIVMEYLEGKTLEERLAEQPDMGLGEAVRIATHVGRALARAHAQGVVHRDLKCGNIFIAKTEDDELGWVAKVLDFGVAKVLTEVSGPSTTKTGTIVGTPLFMSPEQIRGAAHVDHRADLYSLGMVFYNMVTGSHAFDGPSYSDVLVAICTQTLPDIRVAAPWLPPALGAWFDKACARERDARFQSADEMIEALQQAAGPSARLARPSVPDEIGGPSGTLVGYVPPEAAATLVAANTKDLVPARALGTDRIVVSERASMNVDGHRTLGPEASRGSRAPLGGLWLWAASGAGLAMVTVAVGLVILHFMAPHAAVPTVGTQVLQAVAAPEQQHPQLAPPAPAVPAAAAPQDSARNLAPAPIVTAARGGGSEHPSRAPRVSGPRRPASPSAADSPPSSPRPLSTTPDMGF